MLIVVIAVLIGGYYLSTQNKTQVPSTVGREFPTGENLTPEVTADTSALKAGGSSYRDADGIYNFLYPSDYKLDTSDKEHIRIYKTGATQTGQTEMYDGVLMVFETVNLGNQSLDGWVSSSIKNSTSDGTLKVVNPKKAATINGYSGFTYSTQGLGEANYYVISKDANSKNALIITTSVQDPKNVGFENEVKATLATVELFK